MQYMIKWLLYVQSLYFSKVYHNFLVPTFRRLAESYIVDLFKSIL